MLRPALTGALALASLTHAFAFDNGQWSTISPEMQQWFRSLKNAEGMSCCDRADGVRIEDPDWRQSEDGSYEVFARDQWIRIEPGNVLNGTNRVGYAILWWPANFVRPSCFLPGPRW